jgi:trk system potassium uptake protein
MYIVVVGGGKVGYYLTKELLEQGHEVLVIEKDAGKCARLTDELGANALQGDGCEASTLAKAGLGRANVLVAVTGDDEDNLVSCQVAQQKFKVPRTIGRINNPKNEKIFRKLGVSATVSSTEIILSQIEQAIPAQQLIHLLTMHSVGISIVELDIPADSQAVGRPLRELAIPADSLLSLIVPKAGKPIIPNGDTIVKAGDLVISVTSEASESQLRSVFCQAS